MGLDWIGLLLLVAVNVGLVLAGEWCRRAHGRRRDTSRCIRCHYDLRDQTERGPRCPECGTVQPTLTGPRRRHADTFLVGAIAGYLAAASLAPFTLAGIVALALAIR